jgi:protein-disulfide isomerase
MKIYFLLIPVIIGILFASLLAFNTSETPTNVSILNEENLLKGTTILGDPNAKITIIEFGDYQCTFCYKFHKETMNKIYEKYMTKGNVNFVFKDFPLNGEPSIRASEASYCAQEQGEFWTYHNTLYNNWGGENTGWITEDSLLRFAKDSNLKLEEFDSCMENSKFRQKVLDNEQFAKEINIDATPSFLIFSGNEVYRIIGAQPFEKFEQVFQELVTSRD